MHPGWTHAVLRRDHRHAELQRLTHGDRIAVVQRRPQKHIALGQQPQRHRMWNVPAQENVGSLGIRRNRLAEFRLHGAGADDHQAGARKRAANGRQASDLKVEVVLRFEEAHRREQGAVQVRNAWISRGSSTPESTTTGEYGQMTWIRARRHSQTFEERRYFSVDRNHRIEPPQNEAAQRPGPGVDARP